MITQKTKKMWNRYSKTINLISIVLLVTLCAYSTGLLYFNFPVYILNICIFACIVVQIIYFKKINIEITKSAKLIIGFMAAYSIISVDLFIYKIVGIFIILYICLSNKIEIVKKIAIPTCILSVIIFGFEISKIFSLRYKDNLLIEHFIKWVLNVGGIDAEIQGDFLIANLDGKTMNFWVSADAIMLYTFCILILVLWLFMQEKGLKKRLHLLSIVIIYMLIRFSIIIVIYNYTENLEMFWGIIPNIATIVPIAFCVAQECKDEDKISDVYFDYKSFRLYISIWISICLFILGHEYGSIGTDKQGRILIDEWHSKGWESSLEPLNTTKYEGQKSVYTYKSMVDLLNKLYTVKVEEDEDVISKLDDYDILIIKTPTKAFSKNEIDRIHMFIENGGGVLLVGDHTNLFNMNHYLNTISGSYGIKFNYDAVYAIEDGNFVNMYNDNYMRSIATAAVNKYKFATSCSIQPSLSTKIEMKLNNACAEYMDISHVNFFGNMIPESSEIWGNLCVAASKEIGKGRLFAFSDSTTFSSFSMFMHDNPEFLIGIMEYLNKENIVNVYYILGIIFTLVSLALYSKKKNWMVHSGFIFIVLGICVLGGCTSYSSLINKENSNMINSKLNSINTIYFLDDSKVSHFIGYELIEENYQNVFLDIQRHGKILREKENIKDCINRNSEGIVLTNIDRKLSKEEKLQLEQYVAKGGRLILLDSYMKSKESMREILHSFGISKMKTPLFHQIENDKESKQEFEQMSINYYSNQQGDLKEIINSEYTANFNMSIFEYKNGTIYVINDAIYLTNDFIGDQGTPSSKKQYQMHQEFHKLLDKILN